MTIQNAQELEIYLSGKVVGNDTSFNTLQDILINKAANNGIISIKEQNRVLVGTVIDRVLPNMHICIQEIGACSEVLFVIDSLLHPKYQCFIITRGTNDQFRINGIDHVPNYSQSINVPLHIFNEFEIDGKKLRINDIFDYHLITKSNTLILATECRETVYQKSPKHFLVQIVIRLNDDKFESIQYHVTNLDEKCTNNLSRVKGYYKFARFVTIDTEYIARKRNSCSSLAVIYRIDDNIHPRMDVIQEINLSQIEQDQDLQFNHLVKLKWAA